MPAGSAHHATFPSNEINGRHHHTITAEALGAAWGLGPREMRCNPRPAWRSSPGQGAGQAAGQLTGREFLHSRICCLNHRVAHLHRGWRPSDGLADASQATLSITTGIESRASLPDPLSSLESP